MGVAAGAAIVILLAVVVLAIVFATEPNSDRRCGPNGRWDPEQGRCVCDAGWTGDRCQFQVCPNNCSGNGVCIEGEGCLCDDGWTGAACDTPTCAQPCVHGQCQPDGTCLCDGGWGGVNCSEAFPTGCAGQPDFCQNGGQCVTGVCQCPAGFDGDRCEHDNRGPCAGSPCGEHGQCVVSADGKSFSCVCDPGFWDSDDGPCTFDTTACLAQAAPVVPDKRWCYPFGHSEGSSFGGRAVNAATAEQECDVAGDEFLDDEEGSQCRVQQCPYGQTLGALTQNPDGTVTFRCDAITGFDVPSPVPDTEPPLSATPGPLLQFVMDNRTPVELKWGVNDPDEDLVNVSVFVNNQQAELPGASRVVAGALRGLLLPFASSSNSHGSNGNGNEGFGPPFIDPYQIQNDWLFLQVTDRTKPCKAQFVALMAEVEEQPQFLDPASVSITGAPSTTAENEYVFRVGVTGSGAPYVLPDGFDQAQLFVNVVLSHPVQPADPATPQAPGAADGAVAIVAVQNLLNV